VPLKKEIGLPYLPDDMHCTEYSLESIEQEVVGAEFCLNHFKVHLCEIWAEVISGA
jgi:hypothetical protein